MRDLAGCDYVVFRITVVKDPQSKCKPLPIFTRANHRRLYFGSVYDVTGYYFMNGYAFADYCVCSDGTCCGSEELMEVQIDSQYAYKRGIGEGTPTEVDQPFYVIGEESLLNANG
ncbi:hypothetical protein Aduo_006694 [Ancylostoma duodenale]